MRKLVVTLSVVLASLLGASAFAQGPGEDRAAPGQVATPAQKAAAKQARKAEGKAVAKEGVVSDKPQTAATGQKVSASEKKLAKAKRKVEGKEAVKTKDPKVAP